MTQGDPVAGAPASPGSEDSWRGWNDVDIAELLTLDAVGPGIWRSRGGDANKNGRAYGGQVLGQAMMAAHQGVDPARRATLLHLLFVHGAAPDAAITFDVETLQEGKRFTSRHVRGTQAGGRVVCDATASFAVPMASPEHQSLRFTAPAQDPETMPTLADIPVAWREPLTLLGGYSPEDKPTIDFRIPDLLRQLDPHRAQATLRFWIRSRQPLADSPSLHASAFAYLSDWWLNFCGLGLHVGGLDASHRLYISSLNHTIWLHRPHPADQWMCFDCISSLASDGRSMATAHVHDLQGRLVATATQESLMAYA